MPRGLPWLVERALLLITRTGFCLAACLELSAHCIPVAELCSAVLGYDLGLLVYLCSPHLPSYSFRDVKTRAKYLELAIAAGVPTRCLFFRASKEVGAGQRLLLSHYYHEHIFAILPLTLLYF